MRTRGLRGLGAVLVALTMAHATAHAAGSNAARKAYDEATAAFGLGRYAEAAQKYETAFSLRPDPALLYNAAQAYRLAGNRQRALELYRNYLRLYPDRQNADEARNHEAALEKALEGENAAAAPVAPLPASMTSPSAPTAVPAAVPVTAAPTAAQPPLVTTPSAELAASPGEQPTAERSHTWLWIAAGAAVLIGATVALVLATRGDKFPDPSFGTANGN